MWVMSKNLNHLEEAQAQQWPAPRPGAWLPEEAESIEGGDHVEQLGAGLRVLAQVVGVKLLQTLKEICQALESALNS